jgi:hypothetical protein
MMSLSEGYLDHFLTEEGKMAYLTQFVCGYGHEAKKIVPRELGLKLLNYTAERLRKSPGYATNASSIADYLGLNKELNANPKMKEFIDWLKPKKKIEPLNPRQLMKLYEARGQWELAAEYAKLAGLDNQANFYRSLPAQIPRLKLTKKGVTYANLRVLLEDPKLCDEIIDFLRKRHPRIASKYNLEATKE